LVECDYNTNMKFRTESPLTRHELSSSPARFGGK